MSVNRTAMLLLMAGVIGCAPPVDQTTVTLVPEKPTASRDAVPDKAAEPKLPENQVPEVEKPSALFHWAPSREEALKAAAKSGGYVVLAFWVDYSAPCKVMKHEAFNDPVVAKKLEKAIIVGVDAEKETAMMKEYGVLSIPVLVFVKSNGKKFGQIVGYMTLDGFKRDLDRALKG